jgi:hypothetical protein
MSRCVFSASGISTGCANPGFLRNQVIRQKSPELGTQVFQMLSFRRKMVNQRNQYSCLGVGFLRAGPGARVRHLAGNRGMKAPMEQPSKFPVSFRAKFRKPGLFCADWFSTRQEQSFLAY